VAIDHTRRVEAWRWITLIIGVLRLLAAAGLRPVLDPWIAVAVLALNALGQMSFSLSTRLLLNGWDVGPDGWGLLALINAGRGRSGLQVRGWLRGAPGVANHRLPGGRPRLFRGAVADERSADQP
jgi:hypothetical protein